MLGKGDPALFRWTRVAQPGVSALRSVMFKRASSRMGC
jgi:hypothetical protein